MKRLLCRVLGHAWRPTMATCNFRVCIRCRENGWEIR